MSGITLLGNVQQEEIITRLLEFYARVEKLLSSRFPHELWFSSDKTSGSRLATDCLLRIVVRDDLQKTLPGAGIYWDDQLNIQPVYSSSSIVLVDLVDGAKEYAREGSYVTSHLGIYDRTDKGIGRLQMGIVSYPFHQYRILSVRDGMCNSLYYIPFEFDILDGKIYDKLEERKLNSSNSKKVRHVVDRYVCYNPTDPIRRNLDNLRDDLICDGGSYTICRGSVAKTIVDVALGVSDVAILMHYSKAQPNVTLVDYLTPSKMLESNAGIFRCLDGSKPDGKGPIRGFIAAANEDLYQEFLNCVYAKSNSS